LSNFGEMGPAGVQQRGMSGSGSQVREEQTLTERPGKTVSEAGFATVFSVQTPTERD
jgi:hypothetical protein